MKLNIYLLILVSMFFLTSANAGLVVVVNKADAVNKLSKQQVKRIFLGKVKNFPNGSKVRPVDLKIDSSDRKSFYGKVVGKNPAQLKAYWATRIFSGKGVPPKDVGDSSAAKKFISSNPGSIGYLNASSVDSSVKVVYKVQ